MPSTQSMDEDKSTSSESAIVATIGLFGCTQPEKYDPNASHEDNMVHNNQSNRTPTKFNKSPTNIDKPSSHASQDAGISGT